MIGETWTLLGFIRFAQLFIDYESRTVRFFTQIVDLSSKSFDEDSADIVDISFFLGAPVVSMDHHDNACCVFVKGFSFKTNIELASSFKTLLVRRLGFQRLS